MNRRKFLTRVGLIGAVTTVQPSLWLKIISYFKPEKKYVMGGITEYFPADRLASYAKDREFFRLWALREQQNNHSGILGIIQEKFGKSTVNYDWKFRYPEFDEIPPYNYVKQFLK